MKPKTKAFTILDPDGSFVSYCSTLEEAKALALEDVKRVMAGGHTTCVTLDCVNDYEIIKN